MKIQTQSLTGPALDWAVATCEGFVNLHRRALSRYVEMKGYEVPTFVLAMDKGGPGWVEFDDLDYDRDWSRGGPIIEQESIGIQMAYPAEDGKPALWYAAAFATSVKAPPRAHGPTPLVAAMRCFILSRLGEEVDVPDILLEGL